jgi:hypothetical protein
MATFQGRSSTQEDTYCQKTAELGQLGTFAYKIKCKWENRSKKEDRRLRGQLE